MCFSAEASFGASAIVMTIGVIAIKKSTTIPQRFFACVPIIFAIQQFTEGILWLSLAHPSLSPWDKIATYAFLIFAQVVWPTYVPLAVLLLEKNNTRRKLLYPFLALGIIVSSYLAYCLIFCNVHASISCSHIAYEVKYPIRIRHSGVLYFAVTVIPPILSSIKRLHLFGLVIFASYIITKIFYENYLVSVWCYFAAVISIIALSAIMQLNDSAKPQPDIK